ncbi:PAS domain S-box protein [Candidatus Saccharibacteria bacterium]|nr:PAS domain S-box protein [Phycisphaerae bacterium]NIV97918.1 PAS domain S-box protein [Candidatus Saccharibacteria bacterium]
MSTEEYIAYIIMTLAVVLLVFALFLLHRSRKRMFQEIAEREWAVEKLREGDTLLRTVVESTKEAMISIGEDGLIILFNPAAEEMFGRNKWEMVGKPLDCLMPKKYREKHGQYVSSYFATGKPNRAIGRILELPGLRSDGSVFPMEISLSAGRLEDKQFVIAVARDITERKKLEDALRQSEERFREVAEHEHEWIWEVNAEGIYTYASPVVEKMLGYKPEEVVGKKHFYDFFHPDRREELKKEALEVYNRKQPFRDFLNLNIHKDGTSVWLLTCGVPMLDEKGNLRGYRGADIDVTDRMRAKPSKTN